LNVKTWICLKTEQRQKISFRKKDFLTILNTTGEWVMTSAKNEYMELAIKEAMKGMRHNHGGPFGAVIVRQGEVIAAAHNEVLKSSDPTAHAEVLAIRRASKKLGKFDLSDCDLYSTCEPCPMCFAAIHWAKMTTLYFGCSRQDAAAIGFDDAYIYSVLQGKASHQQVQSRVLQQTTCLHLFELWKQKADKKTY
jgi:guanine deaminase